MSHEISTTNGTAHFASARVHAWHRLGTVLPEAMTAEQALDAAHLSGWNVRKAPEFAHITELTDEGVTNAQLETGKFSTIRTNPLTGDIEVLGGGLGKGYTPIQNEEHADLLNTLVDESGAHFETAGALGNGSTVFVSMKMPNTVELQGHEGIDLTEMYLIAQNSHDGTSAFRGMITPVRVVCANTLRAAKLQAKASFSIRHTSGATKNIQVAREALGLVWKYAEEFEVAAQRMIDTEVSQAQAPIILREVLQMPMGDAIAKQAPHVQQNQAMRIDKLMSLWNDADTNSNLRGSAYGLYNAVTEYTDHFMPVQGKGDAELARAARVAQGDINLVKERAFAKLLTV